MSQKSSHSVKISANSSLKNLETNVFLLDSNLSSMGVDARSCELTTSLHEQLGTRSLFPKSARLLSRRDFYRIRREKLFTYRGVNLTVEIARGSDRSRTKLGLSLSRKVGCAVIRNRTKRRLREMFRLRFCRCTPYTLSIHISVNKRPASLSWKSLWSEFEEALKLGVKRIEGIALKPFQGAEVPRSPAAKALPQSAIAVSNRGCATTQAHQRGVTSSSEVQRNFLQEDVCTEALTSPERLHLQKENCKGGSLRSSTKEQTRE